LVNNQSTNPLTRRNPQTNQKEKEYIPTGNITVKIKRKKKKSKVQHTTI